MICHENEMPLDFISTYHYPSGDPLSRAGRNGSGTKGSGIDEDVNRQAMEVRLEKFREIMKQAIGGENNNQRECFGTID